MGKCSALIVLALLIAVGCSAPVPVIKPPLPAKGGHGSIGVVILIDTSGSMSDRVSDGAGHQRPKHVIAKEALDGIINLLSLWSKEHPDWSVNLALLSFSNSTHTTLEVGQFDLAASKEAVKKVPRPSGGTAIGLALSDGWSLLKPLDCQKVFLICITDGVNTSGQSPGTVLPRIYQDSGQQLETHFVAFDVDGKLFDFAKTSNGYVSTARGKPELDRALKAIFQERILKEAVGR